MKSHYGKTFKKLCELKEFKISEVIRKTGIAKSTMSRFLTGQASLTLDQLDAALEAIHVDLAEYDYFLNHFRHNYQEEYFLKIEEAYYKQDKKTLTQIYEEASQFGETMIALSAKSQLEHLSEEEATEVSSFMFGIKRFTYYELSILSNTIQDFSPAMIQATLKDIEKQEVELERRSRYRHLLCLIGCRGALTCMLEGYQKEADVALSFVAKLLFQQDSLSRNNYQFFKGYYLYHYGETKQGIRKMQMAIEVFRWEESTVITDFYQNLFEELVVKAEKPLWLQAIVDEILKGS